MAVRCGQSLVATLLLLVGCADNPPAVIENKSVAAVDVPPEVRQADSNFPDYGRNLPAGPDYVVEPGDTLYAVAFRLGMDYRTLANLNEHRPALCDQGGAGAENRTGCRTMKRLCRR